MTLTKHHFTSLLFIIIPLISNAQVQNEFGWSIGGTEYDVVNESFVDQNGNVYITGEFQMSVDFDPGEGEAILTSAGAADIFIAKYDDQGQFLWAKSMGGISNDYSNDIGLDASGNIYITGKFAETADFDPGSGTSHRTSERSFDIYVAKYDPSGNFLWVNALPGWGHNEADELVVDLSGNVVITGSYQSTVDFDPGNEIFNLTAIGDASSLDTDVFIAKYDALGKFIWAKSIGSHTYEQLYSLGQDASGNLFICGEFSKYTDLDPGTATFTFSGLDDIEIVFAKYDFSGNYIWAKAITGAGSAFCRKMDIGSTGVIHLTGQCRGIVDFDPGVGTAAIDIDDDDDDIFIAKYDESGNYIWAKHIDTDGSDDSGGYDLVIDEDNNVVVTGVFSGATDFDPGENEAILNIKERRDVFIAGYSSAGECLWVGSLASSNTAYGRTISLSVDQSYIVSGVFVENVDIDPLENENLLSSVGKGDIFLGAFSPYVITWLNPANYPEISGYPNPTGDVFSVNLGRERKSGHLVVYAQTGRLVLSKDFEMKNEVRVQIAHPSGLYLVNIRTTDGQVQTMKVVKK